MSNTDEEKYKIDCWKSVRIWDNRKQRRSDPVVEGKIISKRVSEPEKGGHYLVLSLDTGYVVSIQLPKKKEEAK
jgi:hypothetical protein